METISTYLQTLVKKTRKPEAELMSLAVEVGLRQLWREYVLGAYLRQNMSRGEAINLVGLDLVILAEKQEQAMMEDLAWALQN